MRPLPCTRIHSHPPSTLLHPQRLLKRRLGTILGPFNPRTSPPACHARCLQNTALSIGAADLFWLAFFFLLCPGEYTITGTAPHPFTLADIHLWHHDTPIDPLMASPNSLLLATFVILIFMDQKNAVHSKMVGHGCSGDPQACPVLAIVHCILHLRLFNAPPHTPLCALNTTGSPISARSITTLLHQGGLAFSICSNVTLPILHQKALWATGASELLAQGANYKTIKLLGCLKSDAAMWYLHLQSRMLALAPSMLKALH
jgi:hypothetical protein